MRDVRSKQFETEALAEEKTVKEVISFEEGGKDQLQFVLQIMNDELSLVQKPQSLV